MRAPVGAALRPAPDVKLSGLFGRLVARGRSPAKNDSREIGSMKVSFVGGAVALLAMAGAATSAWAQMQKIGDPPEAKNMELVGYDDLQSRSAYQPVIQHQGNRYIAYIGHHGGTRDIPNPFNPLTGQMESNGTSIVDVTDPAHPKYLAHIPGEDG